MEPTAAAPLEHRVPVGDVVLHVFEWNPAARGRTETFLLAHATGFHARCWDRVVARLGDRHVLAVDQRGHGRSGGTLPLHWRQFGDDLVALVQALGLEVVVGVGHSMGGHAMVEAAAVEGPRFRRLVLVDPVILPPAVYGTVGTWTGRLEGQHPVARRRLHWTSPEEMFERFRTRPPFDAWDPAVLRDYCVHGLLPDPAGGFVLACRPEYEAEIYMTSHGNGRVHERVPAVGVPVLVVRAMQPPSPEHLMDFRYSPTWPRLAAAFRDGRDLHLPDRTHFLPMEDPALTARLVLEGDEPGR